MRIGRLFLGAAIAAVLAGGCGGDVTEDPGGGGAGGSGTTSTGEGAGTSTGTGEGGGPFGCASDAECAAGAQWCVNGTCVPCDNSATVCDITCPQGWTTYERNGCTPCECAPTNASIADADCPGPAAQQCYAGNFCWDWCPPGDPSCCFGNTCSGAGCPGPNPSGCHTTGCAQGEACVDGDCTSSSCSCDGQSWGCTDDCGGGSCVPL